MTSEEKDNLLDRYVTGQPMSVEEEDQVNKWLDTDTDFRLAYRLQQQLFDAGRRQRRSEWNIRQQTRPIPAPKTAFPMRWAAAASVVLLLGIGLVWWVRSSNTDQMLVGQADLFEQRDTQLGLAPNDSAVGKVEWSVTKASRNEYEFRQVDTLRLFSTQPAEWNGQTLQIIRLSEVRYQLRVGNKTYLLEQGRNLRLPLEPEQ